MKYEEAVELATTGDLFAAAGRKTIIESADGEAWETKVVELTGDRGGHTAGYVVDEGIFQGRGALHAALIAHHWKYFAKLREFVGQRQGIVARRKALHCKWTDSLIGEDDYRARLRELEEEESWLTTRGMHLIVDTGEVQVET